MLGSKLLILYRHSEVDDILGSKAEPDPENGGYITYAEISRNDRSIDDVIQNFSRKYRVTTDL